MFDVRNLFLVGKLVGLSQRLLVPVIFLGSSLLLVRAQPIQAPQAVHSSTRQFIVHPAERPNELLLVHAEPGSVIGLTQGLLVVACERIKRSILAELGQTDAWRGKIRVLAYRASHEGDMTAVEGVRFADGWQYDLRLPNPITKEALVRSLVNVLLWEFANRGSERSADLPHWLVEALTTRLLLYGLEDFGLETPEASISSSARAGSFNSLISGKSSLREGIWKRPEEISMKVFRTRPPLSFHNLGAIDSRTLHRAALHVYQANAHVFFAELLKLDGGRQKMANWLVALTRYWNWQTAFYQVFGPQLGSALEVEKWWAVVGSDLMGRDESETWDLETSKRRFDGILRIPIRVQQRSESLPVSDWVSLQGVIGDWDFMRQKTALGEIIRQLSLSRLVIHKDYLGLVDAYRDALMNYLVERQKGAPAFALKNRPQNTANVMAAKVKRRLDELDSITLRYRVRSE
jgi:hypothetical protein